MMIKRMPRVLVLNNYPLDEVWEEVRRKEKPDHHLFGINYFENKGYDVSVVPYKFSRFLQKTMNLLKRLRFPIPMGDLDQQWSVFSALNKCDLIYAPCQTQCQLLSYFRALGLIRVPIVCIAHHPLNFGRMQWLRSPFVRMMAGGTDAFPSLSTRIAQSINELVGKTGRSCALSWGPQESFYETAGLGSGIVCAGRTGRDLATFGQAATQAGTPATIICNESSALPEFKQYGVNVKICVQPDSVYMKYPQLLDIYAKSRAIAIPMYASGQLCGLTSLVDALGAGKPVIMTRNPYIDLDIEKHKIGIWVDAGDVSGWVRAIQYLETHDDEAIEMGARARGLVNEIGRASCRERV